MSVIRTSAVASAYIYERVYQALIRVETQHSMGLWQVFLPSLPPVPSPLPSRLLQHRPWVFSFPGMLRAGLRHVESRRLELTVRLFF